MCPRQAEWAVTWVASAVSGRLLNVEASPHFHLCQHFKPYCLKGDFSGLFCIYFHLSTQR